MHEFLNSPLGVALGAILGMAVPWLIIAPIWWWQNRRDQRAWDRREAERQRQWAVQQLWAMERAIWEERLSDEEREALEEARARQRAITREARRRLGLPEEAPPAC
jgi:uncharacterized protein YbjT (DUF2867 family)